MKLRKHFVDPNKVILVPLMKCWSFMRGKQNDHFSRRSLEMEALETYIANSKFLKPVVVGP